MKSTQIGMQEWMEYFRQATQEVAGNALKFDAFAKAEAAVGARGAGTGARQKADAAVKADAPRPGAYISLLSQTSSMHLGITSTAEGCRALALGMLGLHSGHEVSDKEIGDAVSELMNIIAGKVKSRVSERDQTLQLGLPMFIQGRIQETGSMERQALEIQVGPVPCQLLVYRSKRPG